ncbi:MAG: hypothetical protein Q8P22_05450, partial [Chloroflexota bacterium]|nr:hypothetical protein [Chloroflexota bacterium]
FGIGATAVVLLQTALAPNVAGWATPWLGSLALMVAIFGVLGMLSGQGQEGPAPSPSSGQALSAVEEAVKPFSQRLILRRRLAWALGCAAGLASFAIVTWRVDAEAAIAWPTALLAGLATAVLVGLSEAPGEDQPDETPNPASLPPDKPNRRLSLPTEAAGAAVALGLAGATLALHAWQTDAGWYQPPRVVVGSLYVLVVPGWYLSRLFADGKLDLIERSVLVVALSVVAVPLGLMWINFLGGRIDFLTTWTLVLAIAVLGAVLSRARLILSAAATEGEASRRAGILTIWNSRPSTQKALLLSMGLWLLAIGGLAAAAAAPGQGPYGILGL